MKPFLKAASLALAALSLTQAPAAACPYHQFLGWQDDIAPLAYVATISVPTTAPAVGEYAWVAVEVDQWSFAQVGWAWSPASGWLGTPTVFAYSTVGALQPATWLPTTPGYAYGPHLQPGSSASFAVAHDGDLYYLEYEVPGGTWTVLAMVTMPGAPVWQTYAETVGPPVQVCFTGRAAITSKGWRSLPDGCQG
jgi:hypothetical protein